MQGEIIGRFVIVLAAVVFPSATLAYFYFHVQLSFRLIVILIFTRSLIGENWLIVNLFTRNKIGLLLYVNLIFLLFAAVFRLFSFTQTECVILGTQVATNLLLLRR
jgi:hypothetical protein